MDFDLNKKYMHNNDIHNSNRTIYKSNNLATKNTVNKNFNILISREENHLGIQESYLVIEFNVSDNAGGIIANDANVRLLICGAMELFSSFSLEFIGGKTIENIDHSRLILA